jgi:hypothetical protein
VKNELIIEINAGRIRKETAADNRYLFNWTLSNLLLLNFFTREFVYNPNRRDNKIEFTAENSYPKTLVKGKFISAILKINIIIK